MRLLNTNIWHTQLDVRSSAKTALVRETEPEALVADDRPADTEEKVSDRV